MEQIVAYENINHLEGIQTLGNAIAESGMFGASNDSQGMIIALQCMSENKPPLEMAKTYHIIKGKLTKRADAMHAEFKQAGGKFRFEDIKNPTVQKAIVNYEDYKDFKVEYSIDDAKSAGVYNTKADSPWQRTPAAMLRARLISETLRAIAPEIVTGVYTPEEASQFDEPTTVSQPKPKAAPAKAEPKPEPKKAEVIETEIVEEKTTQPSALDAEIEKLIKGSAFEDRDFNIYFGQKKLIDQDLGTWRDLDDSMKKKMRDQFSGLVSTLSKGSK